MDAQNYVSVDRIFSKLNRDLKGSDFNESDIIEWIGEALDFLSVPQILVEDVKFVQVENHHGELPENLHLITQIARDRSDACFHNPEPEVREWKSAPFCDDEEIEEHNFSEICNVPDELLNMPEVYLEAFLEAEVIQTMNPEQFNDFNLDWNYQVWSSSNYYTQNFTPVRLTSNTFFNSIVCKEKDQSLYNNCGDEYTIVGDTNKRMRFSFRDGVVAVSYLKNSVDKETGYPLIPDNISYITAITYYIKWKMAEHFDWIGREGWANKALKAETSWGTYVKQAKNGAKMPKTLDQYQNLLEASHYLVPKHNQYYGFFGNLNKREAMNFQTQNKRH